MPENIERRQTQLITDDLPTKMVLLSGPRQCGKTTLARALLSRTSGAYYSWDVADHRRVIRTDQLDASKTLWVFDELHKYRQWRNWLKGQYDLHREAHRFLVTGSARLDVYSRGGDSLQGRYFHHRLHPFTLSEVLGTPYASELSELPARVGHNPGGESEALDHLLAFSGFPEPFSSGSRRHLLRWQLNYGTRLVREDIHDLENLRELDRLELLYDRLPDVVGSVLSINALREDLEVAFETARHWISVFERTYAAFRIAPFGAPRIKAVKKEQKLYLWDWARVEKAGARLENLVALHLLRLTHWAADAEGEKLELRFFRDTVGHEVDFILLWKGKPWMAIEVKQTAQGLDSGLRYLLERSKIPHAFQLHLEGVQDFELPPIQGTRVRSMPLSRFLAALP